MSDPRQTGQTGGHARAPLTGGPLLGLLVALWIAALAVTTSLFVAVVTAQANGRALRSLRTRPVPPQSRPVAQHPEAHAA
jgi:hypothetical protein